MNLCLPQRIVPFYIILALLIPRAEAQEINGALTSRQKGLVSMAAYTAQGDLKGLAKAQHEALDAGLSVNEIKEALIHVYAYAGFPRSIRGLQTFMTVIDERKSKGINDPIGRNPSPVNKETIKYERGRKILNELTNTRAIMPITGYGAFAPTIDTFLKEHLFADIFERDILSYADREWVTISVISAIGNAEPMLRSHLGICLNVGITKSQLQAFIPHITPAIGVEKANAANTVLLQVLGNESSQKTPPPATYGFEAGKIFPTGQKITNANFHGTAYLQVLAEADSINPTAVGNVTFEPGARTRWHYHPGGQILLATDGVGYYQEKGKPKRLLKKGEVVRCAPNTPHWHGASSNQHFVQIALTNNQRGGTVWLEHVTEEEYHAPVMENSGNQ